MTCPYCGDDETRVDGHCSIECRDAHTLTRERDQAQAERDAALGEIARLRCEVGRLERALARAVARS